MGLALNKDASGNYRRVWYAVISEKGRHVSRKLKTPMRGTIPLDGSGRFSIALTGDEAFEASKAAARAELETILTKAREAKTEEREDPGYIDRQVFRKLHGRKFDMMKLSDLAERNATRERYQLTGDKTADKYNQSVKDILNHFAKWAANYSSAKHKKHRVTFITDITPEVVGEYYQEISAAYSWQTFRKYVFILKSVYAYFIGKGRDNPFHSVYKDGYTYKQKIGAKEIDKTSVVHEALDSEQIRRVWEYTRTRTDKPYLHRLAVLAACTGMRIGDCCNLTWDKVDLLGYKIHTRTKKTGKPIGVQIFDYAPDSADYHEILGELRRELEAALAERDEGEVYVIPEAARIYQANPTRINKEGKAIFAHALFGNTEPEPEDATLVGEDKPAITPAKIITAIGEAKMSEKRRAKVSTIYTLYAEGKSYAKITDETGFSKGTICDALAYVEELTGATVRKGNPYLGNNAKQGIKKLLKKTRQARGRGQRAACLYGWHSFRVAFVVMAIDLGVEIQVLKEIVGHATIDMTMHYYNPKELQAAEIMRRTIQRRNLKAHGQTKMLVGQPVRAALPPPTATQQARTTAGSIKERIEKLDALLADGVITQDERDDRRRAILNEI